MIRVECRRDEGGGVDEASTLEAEANARLIANAPDLVFFAEQLLNNCLGLPVSVVPGCAHVQADDANKLNQVIQKIKGLA